MEVAPVRRNARRFTGSSKQHSKAFASLKAARSYPETNFVQLRTGRPGKDVFC
jgi:hypothetical protein